MAKNEKRRLAIEMGIQAIMAEGYHFCHWSQYDYRILSNISYLYRAGSKDKRTINDVIIMGDTETSKKDDGTSNNHIVAWTISLRIYGFNMCTLYGHRPDTFVKCLLQIHNSMRGDRTFIYFHNLPYDWVFLRAFIMEEMGTPENQLNVKPHYPLFIEFTNGIMFKDSLMLAQRGLEKWAKDLNVEHQKAVGSWDYDLIRDQKHDFTPAELEYIEHDTLAGVECIDIMRKTLRKYIYSIPYTATGIPREEVRKRGGKNRGRGLFERIVPTYEQQEKLELVFHGGYTHANRHFISQVLTKEDDGLIECRDFASSYPYCMLAEKFPMERFHTIESCRMEDIINLADKYAVICKLILVKPRLRDDFCPMPVLQYSKTIHVINPVTDNGRILCAAYVEIYCSEQDIIVINEQYKHEGAYCVEVEVSEKDYLPKWLRDYVYELFHDKTTLKGGDPVLYALKKAELNSVYGMCVQKPVKDMIIEDYKTGEFSPAGNDPVEAYKAYCENKKIILPYQWGVWVTAYALRHLFQLGYCVDGCWIYSDTDSCYATGWNEGKLAAYNNECKEKLKASGYGPVTHNGREYWLGVAEFDGAYTEYVALGAKRYCGRSTEDGKLHITIAGVPKIGAACLKDDINNFKKGTVFDGISTGKKTHTYLFSDVYYDKAGNLTGDSIDLTPCDYLLDDVNIPDWEAIFREEIEVQVLDLDNIGG